MNDEGGGGDLIIVINLLIKVFVVFRFASWEIVHWYGYLLQDFNENDAFVNDCIFTMMHHVAGDCDNINLLFQPTILKVFSKIWDTGFELCDVSKDKVKLNSKSKQSLKGQNGGDTIK